MRFQLMLFILITILASGCLKTSVEISGKLDSHAEGGYIFIDELRSDELFTIDSVALSEDGTFELNLNIKDPAFYLLKTNDANYITLLLSPGEKLKFESHFDSLNFPYSVSGSKGTELLTSYNNRLRETVDQLTALNSVYVQNQDSPDLPKVIESLDSLAQMYLSEINSYTKNYIDNNLTSLASLVALYQQIAPNVYVLNPSADLNYYIKVDSSLSINYPDYEPVVALSKQVKEFMALSPQSEESALPSGTGAEAPEIALPDPDGNVITLSSTRGSVVLLDFWAAWCAPCRQENPNLVKAYNLYHKKGFQIYQVSLDKTKESWVKGINDDHLERWIHVSDVKFWNSIVVPLYNIQSIPANYLLDRDGKIIASNLRGEMLQIKLAEIFGK